MTRKDYKLYFSIILYTLLPSIYLLIRMYIVTVQAVDIDILGQMDIRAIVYMFGIGMIVHMLVSMVCYRWEIRKLLSFRKNNILKRKGGV